MSIEGRIEFEKNTLRSLAGLVSAYVYMAGNNSSQVFY